MELVLNNVSYDSTKMNKKLNNVTYTFLDGITFCNGLSGHLLKELLFQERSLASGYIMVSEYATKKDVGVVLANQNKSFTKNNVLDEMLYLNEYYHLNYMDVDKKIDQALKMVNLDITYKKAYFSDLSTSELKKIALANVLFINPKIIILDYFDNNICAGDMEYFRKLLLKLAKGYHKTIIICSDNLNAYLSIINNLVVFKSGSIVFKGCKDDLYNDKLYEYIDMPPIIEMIKYLNKKGHKFDNYIDIKELIKAIYRDVENK